MAGPAQDAFELLAENLDQAPLGAPQGPELMAILRELFSEPEAGLAATMAFRPVKAAKIAEQAGLSLEQAQDLLEAMAQKGLVYRRRTPRASYYSLLPMVPGMAEAQFWASTAGGAKRRMAELFEAYYEPGVGKAFSEAPTPYSRVIPVGRAVDNSQEILPFEQAEELIRQHEHLALTDCYCRQQAHELGQGCDAPLDVCMIFGSFAEFAVEQGWAKKASPGQMLEALARAEEAGLVHVVDNVAQNVNFLCNCCGDCCMFLQTITRLNKPGGISQAAYLAEVDPEACVACGECEAICQVAAVKVDDETAEVDQELCLGCGLCVTACPNDALVMRRRTARPVPAHHGELIASLAARREAK
ncbi:MAG: 4Fe-4S binding protein [Desulfarculaceae bacterium]|nr:4Fe-4S binding protein [Desulfarculaceae bacterium]MCF8073613.1 4Fe-4S binding protein [Desulfarculaceae bacterium]MCF8103155.1 4Fe-4S binding protein [Desulfarculaceae bacterium]MCF8115671.1 4Fe-4S binding protein [Desulfarculaceae bacterium]